MKEWPRERGTWGRSKKAPEEGRMRRPIAIIGAPSSIGIRPYDDGRARRLDLAPQALRERGLVERLRARDMGDVAPPPYRDFERLPGATRNEQGVAEYSRALAQRVATAEADDHFVVVLGGDCSIVLGCLLGLRARGERIGLAYVDGHADFFLPSTSRTGSAASMCLAMAVGLGDTPLARLAAPEPLVRGSDTVVIGRRDQYEDPTDASATLHAAGIGDVAHAEVRGHGPAAVAERALARVGRGDLDGFWIHVDADVLDPTVLPAVDSPEPDGMRIDELSELLAPLVTDPRALGLELTIYDPTLDPDGSSAAHLVGLLEQVLARQRAWR